MAEVISPATAMSASQRAKKVSMTEDEPALAAWITEVVETLSRPAGIVQVANHHVTKVKDQLSDLRENGDEIDPGLLEGLFEILAKDAAMCRRLKSDAFALLVEVLLETSESNVRERGFYILAKSLHEEAFDAQDSFTGRLHEIGRGCLVQLYERFVERTVAYGSRRWMGSLLMEMIGDSEENQQDIAMMSTSKRAKLGSAVLYESSEIIRAISGRLLAVMLGADHEARSFFPPGTSEKLFKDYPGSVQSGSQWDKAFQAYVDEIWKAIEAYNEYSGELQFAQHVATVPSHRAIESGALARDRSIYIETSDSVRVYMHLGNEHFDSAVDIPLTSIEGIETTITLVDQSQSKEYVDIVLRLKPSMYCFVNSTQTSLSVVRLTVESQEMADGVRDGIVRSLAAMTELNNTKDQIIATPSTRANTQESIQSKKSYGDEDLVLNGSYEPTVVNDSFVAVAAAMSISGATIIEEDPFIASVHQGRPIVVEMAQLPQEHNAASDANGKYAEEHAPEKQASLLRTSVELDVVKDIDTGEVLSSKVLGMVVVPKVRRRPSIKPVRPVAEGAIERSADSHRGNHFSSEDVDLEIVENVVTPPPQKQTIKSRGPTKDSRGQPSTPEAAGSVGVEKIVVPANQQTFKSKASAGNDAHADVAEKEDLKAAVDVEAPLPKKQDLKSKAPKKATQGQQSARHEEKPLESEEVVISLAKRQGLKSKTPVGVAKRKDDKPADPEQGFNKPPKTSRLESELQALPSLEEEGTQNTKLVAPSKKNIKTATKGSTEGNLSKQTLPSYAHDEDIYGFIPSPPKAEKNTKAAAKGKKATATTTSVKGYGKKSKANERLLLSEVEEAVTVTKPSKVKKEPAKKKPLKQPVAPPPAVAAAPKRKTAPRSTKGKKSMKDLSDSEIENDELLMFTELKETKGSTPAVKNAKAAARSKIGHEASGFTVVTKPAPTQQARQNTTTVQDLGKETLDVDTEDMVQDHPEVEQKASSKTNVARTAVIDQRKVNRDATPVDARDTKQWSPSDRLDSSLSSQIDDENPFDDQEHNDNGEKALPSTAGLQNLTGTTVEARIGRKMAEILGFSSTKVQKPQQEQQASYPRKGAEPMSSSRLAAVLETKKYADEFDNSMSAPSSKNGSEAIIEDGEFEGDGFSVLSSPRILTEDVATVALHMIKEHSSADDPIVLSDSEEDDEDDEDEESVAQAPVRNAIKKCPVLTPVIERPAKRQRLAKEASLSSPLETRVVSSSERATSKVNAQARRPAIHLPGSGSYVAAVSEAASSIDQLALLDDHQARKAPLISFGPHGPRNQGFSSAVKSARVLSKEKPNTLSSIMDNLSKKSMEKRPSPAKQASNATVESTSRTPRVPSFEDSLARYDTIALNIQREEDDGLVFFDAGQSVASSRSHSRVDVNGSPKPRRVPLAPPLGGRRHVSQTDLKSDIGSTTSPRPQRYTAPAEKASSRATFEDDTTLFGSGLFISSNRKARPAAPDDDLDFESRYTPHHAAKNGDYVGVADLKVVDAAPAMADPFSKKVKRQDSGFAQRLRLSQTFHSERDDKPQEPPTTKAQARFQAPTKPVSIQSHLSSVADVDATLVNIENCRPQHRQWKKYHASSSDSSDNEAEAYEESYETPSPDPQQIWKEALKPHQKDMSDVLHHVVDGLLQRLFDTEPAVYAIADEYRANGAKIVEALKSKMDADIRGLYHRSTATIEDLATTLRQSRAALQSESEPGKALDDQYRQWRVRQHALQLLPFMAREVGGRR